MNRLNLIQWNSVYNLYYIVKLEPEQEQRLNLARSWHYNNIINERTVKNYNVMITNAVKSLIN